MTRDNRQLVTGLTIQFKTASTVSTCSRKPLCGLPRLSEVFPSLSLKHSKVGLTDDGPFSPCQRSSLNTTPDDRWRDVLGCVPADCVSDSSALQIFRDASHWGWLLCRSVSLFGHLPSFRLVQDSISQGVVRIRWMLSIVIIMPIWASPSRLQSRKNSQLMTDLTSVD